MTRSTITRLLTGIFLIVSCVAGRNRNLVPLSLSDYQMKILDEIISGDMLGLNVDVIQTHENNYVPTKDVIQTSENNYIPNKVSLSVSSQHSSKHQSTRTQKSLGKFGSSCSKYSPCNSEDLLVCLENRCACDNSALYNLDDSSRSKQEHCVGKVGGTCLSSSHCVRNAYCTPTGRCECNTGFTEDSQGFCYLGYNMPCEGNDCNPSIPLVCKDFICSCRDDATMYDSYRKSCVGLVGAQCSQQRLDGSMCVQGAVCEQFNKNLPGRCICPTYKVEASNRTCMIDPEYN